MFPDGLEGRVYVAGHRGMVGRAIWSRLGEYPEVEPIGWSSDELDLREREATRDAIAQSEPNVIIMAAARVGGIGANAAHPVEFLNDNLLIQINLLEAAHEFNVPRLLFLGSSCIYPKYADQPISETALLTGPLEPTNEAYALAKIAGVRAVQFYRREYGRDWISAMPTNLYGPGDNFDINTAHVLPALVARFEQAKAEGIEQVALWGTGSPMREFLYVDDLAVACLTLLSAYSGDSPVNVGSGDEIAIRDLASLVARVCGYQGRVTWEPGKPDGTPRKLLNSGLMRSLGWRPQTSLEEGISLTVDWYRGNEQGQPAGLSGQR